jgi:hypothetical protein
MNESAGFFAVWFAVTFVAGSALLGINGANAQRIHGCRARPQSLRAGAHNQAGMTSGEP